MHFPLVLQTIDLKPTPVTLYIPDAAAVRKAYEEGKILAPYWSQVWPAAKALAQFLLDNPDCIRQKNVLELGAGLGLPSLVAAGSATAVLCTDIAPEAIAAVKASIAFLGLKNVCAETVDWAHLPENLAADVVLLSDINYEPAAFQQLLELIAFFLEKGTLILLCTPQRLLAKEFIQLLLRHCTHQEEIWVEHEGRQVATTVLMLEKSPAVHVAESN